MPFSESSRRGDSRIEDRLRRAILPLLRAMDRPCQPDELRVQIMNEPAVNAANAGGCQFFVTSGLLQRANGAAQWRDGPAAYSSVRRRAGYPPEVMINTLSWIQRALGDQQPGGFLSTHPALKERISALKKIR
jgi:predicted Zn-dependent protease